MQAHRVSFWLGALGLFLTCSAPPVAPQAAQTAAPRYAVTVSASRRIDALLQTAVERKQIAGAVALLIQDGKILYSQGIGQRDVEAGQPMTPDTIFRIASMTKPVTSVVAMTFVEEGRLGLHDPVSKYIPDFGNPKVLVPGKASNSGTVATVPAQREPTVHDLLTHTSGLTYGFFGKPVLSELYRKAGVSDGLVQTDWTLAENVRRLAELPLLVQPGSAWEYGLSTDVLGRVIEVASGQSLDRVFQERIFRPLQMRDSHFFLPPEKNARLAAVYTPGPDKAIRRVGEEPVQAGPLTYSASYPYRGPRLYYSGGAGLVSTARDYARFLAMLLGGGELDGVRVLKPETIRLMTTNQIGELRIGNGDQGAGFGYGFGVVMQPSPTEAASVGTYSWGGFFNTSFWVDPDKKLIGILMTQLYPANDTTLQADFKKLAHKVVAGQP
jgi:CubicO group peptidase (beta-lactamase class C family)